MSPENVPGNFLSPPREDYLALEGHLVYELRTGRMHSGHLHQPISSCTKPPALIQSGPNQRTVMSGSSLHLGKL